jgi:hypothetical protein
MTKKDKPPVIKDVSPKGDDIIWIAFHRDAIEQLGTRSTAGYKLIFSLANERLYEDGQRTAELVIRVEDDGMRVYPLLLMPKERNNTLGGIH